MLAMKGSHGSGSNNIHKRDPLRCSLQKYDSAAFTAVRSRCIILPLCVTSPLLCAVSLFSGALQLSSYKRKIPGGRYPKNYF